jgi:hypothetical protein
MKFPTVILFIIFCSVSVEAFSQDRHAVIVSGASGGEVYAASHQKWRAELISALKGALRFPDAHVVVLSEEDQDAARATAPNVQRAFNELRARVTRDDLVMVVLLGHGTFDGADAKFNLVGPDLTASQWKQLLSALPARTVIVNTTASSFPFLDELSHRGRVVITATDTAAQRFATVFPQYFVHAVGDPASDADKNGRLSVWEAFAAASAGVKRHFEQRGQLPTERPLLDDDGNRIGREAEAPGDDGAVARALYLDAPPAAIAASAALTSLEHERAAIEGKITDLKSRKGQLPEADYQSELERLLVELARVSREIRLRS